MEIYLSIGGNIGDRLKNIKDAIDLISTRISLPEKVSPLYLNEPWGFKHKRYFVNGVIKLKSEFSPSVILEKIIGIEKDLKRVRTKSGYEGRTIDIDILYIDDKVIDTSNLTVPHPRIKDRLFVLLPLRDISPDFIEPLTKKHINQLIDNCNDNSKIKKLEYGT